jgi:[acyl-carrier-protein] S-malonyltransferase
MADSKLAFVFPGQGSQSVGMLSEFYTQESSVVETFGKASEVLGYDLWALVSQGPESDLNMTENTQPALLTASVAIYQLWCSRGGQKPDFLAGHSLGEWSALVCAGVVTLEEAVRLVQLRGRYMQEAVPVGEGSMAAIIGLDDDAIVKICADLSGDAGVVSAVNFNSPGQVVIAGTTALTDQAGAACAEAGAKRVVPLAVSAPFHTSLMKPAADRLAKDMAEIEFKDPSIPVVHNVTAATEASGASIKSLMVEQIYSPVRWVECVQYLASQGVAAACECGPGKVLSGLMRRIDRSVSATALESQATFDKQFEQ